MVVLPEAFATGFSLNPKATTRAEPDQTYAFLSNVSISHKIWILAGVIVPNENKTKAKNIAVLFNPNGKQVGVYQKMYPFTPMGEEKVYTRGKSTKTFDVDMILMMSREQLLKKQIFMIIEVVILNLIKKV